VPAKIKSKLLKNTSILDLPAIKKEFARSAKNRIRNTIKSEIAKGKTVVSQRKADPKNTNDKGAPKGGVRFQKYSNSYKERMGRGDLASKTARPVNMKVTGKMMNSLKQRVTSDSLVLWFSDKKAEYHNKLGAGKSKVIRRILPSQEESFTPIIRKRLVKILERAIRRVAK
jgi:hypothetical protein